MRGLSEDFMSDLKAGGMLHPLLVGVREDRTLMLAIREDNFNIYYRGGSIIKISKKKNGNYKTCFNSKYNKEDKCIPKFPQTITCNKDSTNLLNVFDDLKKIMERYFDNYRRSDERELQQEIVKVNNFYPESHKNDYYITDIEYIDKIKTRIDIVALKRTEKPNNFRPALMELKYEDGALKNKSGLIDHLEKMSKIINCKATYPTLVSTMQNQFNQLKELGLLDPTAPANINVDPTQIPEVIIIIANHNHRSTILRTVLNERAMEKFAAASNFSLKFYCINGNENLALIAENMMSLQQFKQYLK